ncbi:enoyl-CoA hydratase-related protein [Blastococcus sp. TF02A-30]|uniref:enoyl-CoA hydratase-related protein n=1 Tax=Blastococcus sp. TF02A-30 TaxID=2250580 RepID=UPI000DEAF059|nr:enoyl-CoA hydratase-related protein [Blastococcus sp. TF02A-30]RBY84132.1 enoyl-CoA hydratase [Blastococcus sp. TF02A-30]
METLIVERADGVATVSLNRPPVNAVTRQMQLELREAFDSLSEDRQVGAVVLAAEGERAFCGGIDLKETAAQQSPADLPLQNTTNPGWEWRAAQHAIRHCAVPVIAAVDGPAIGAGFGMVGVCDIIIASSRASFGLTEINVGLLGGASKAMNMLGPRKARMMMFTGRLQPAEELHRLGAVEEVVAPGEARARALAIAAEIAGKSPLAVRLAKESIVRIEGDEMERQYRTEWDYTNRLRGFDDSREAMAAYLEKRRPNWTFS